MITVSYDNYFLYNYKYYYKNYIYIIAIIDT